MANVKVTVKGPLFDAARNQGVLNKGIRNGTLKLAPRVQAEVKRKLLASGVPSGRYANSITTKVYDSGFGVVKSDDPRKLRTWLETGRRRGVKTRRKGAYAWRAGKNLAKAENKAGYYEAEIAAVLR